MNRIKLNTNIKYIFMVILIVFLIVLFFNDKLNRQFNELKSELKIIEKKSDDITKPRYKFPKQSKYKIPSNYSVKKDYFLLSDIEKVKKEYSKDEKGVLLTKRPEKVEEVYHPVLIAQFGLKTLALYNQTRDVEWQQIALKQADFFVENINNGGWDYTFDFPVAKEVLESPWGSAMATGQVLSLLSRAYLETNNEKYLQVCSDSLKLLSLDVKDGGYYSDFMGYAWYEEYPTKVPNYTLNGFMFTLIGLHEYWEISENQEAYKLYQEGMKTLDFALPFFDSDEVSLYHLGHLFNKGFPVTINLDYHGIHVLQLGVLLQWEDSQIIDYYLQEWKSYME